MMQQMQAMAMMNPMYGQMMMNYNMMQQAAQVAAPEAQGKYHGWVKSMNIEKGFGFIVCPQTYAQYNRDVFVRGTDLVNLQQGSYVSFTCEANKQNMPQARDVRQMPAPYGASMPMDDKGKGKGKGKGKDGGKDGKGKGKKGKGKDGGKDGKGKGKKGK